MKGFTLAFLSLALSLASFAQTAPAAPTAPAPIATAAAPSAFPSTTFSVNLSPITLPGGKSSVTGTMNGASISVTPNVDVENLNIISTSFNYFAGGAKYFLPSLSKALNNASPTLNGFNFQFYLTGTVGAVKVLGGPQGGHWGETVGGGINYAFSGNIGLGVEVQYAKLPGYANNTWLAAFGPNFHF
jgi:hypothetical protein